MSSKHQLSRRDLWSPGDGARADPESLVHLASLLVHGTPQACAQVRELVRLTQGAEVHATSHAGKLVIVLESADDRAIADTAAQLQDIGGVVNVSIVAHLVESERALREDHVDG
jgi:nitrate reductase NapD